ncbi:MAG: 3-oxoacyl-[acyl-carrier-protein] synthase [Solirubrobacteraceae bacterium]|nr:3-oxoacyl-[acyl-carrier-protein] synthase [Solirubrobacteraceae bacterium]
MRDGRAAAMTSVAAGVPSRKVSTAEIAERLDVPAEWIVRRTGVESRHRARSDERLTDLAAEVSLAALAKAGRSADEVDLVLVATMTPDEITPHAAPQVAAAIGAHAAGAVDVGAACTAFFSAVALAVGQIESGRSECAVIVGADFMSRVLDYDDPVTAGIFGDGAGAVVIEAVTGPPRFGPFVMGADGAAGSAIVTPRPAGPVTMDGQATFRRAVDTLEDVSRRAAELAGAPIQSIDLAVFHQANGRITKSVRERLGLPSERVVDCIDRYGNTTAATLPMALAHADAHGQLAAGSRVLLAAFGAGLTWGGTVLTWGREPQGACG